MNACVAAQTQLRKNLANGLPSGRGISVRLCKYSPGLQDAVAGYPLAGGLP